MALHSETIKNDHAGRPARSQKIQAAASKRADVCKKIAAKAAIFYVMVCIMPFD